MSYTVNYLLQQTKETFVNENGQSIPYTATKISGYVAGEYIEVNLKIEKGDRKLVGLLLNAAEDVNVVTAKAAEQIVPETRTSPVMEKPEEAVSWLNED